MAVGRFNNLLVAADCLEAGRADLFCFGRTSLADPELPNKLAENRLDEQIPCIGCTQSCVSALTNPARGFKTSCLINPVTGHEFEYDLTPVAPEKAKKVLVVGGGLTGCETADFLCEHNRIVSVMEMAPVIAADAEATPRRFLMQRLNKWSHALDFYSPALSVYTGAKIKQFYDDGVAYEMGGEVKELHGFDSIILSLGVKSYNPLEEVAKSLCGEVYVVGDVESAGNANHATDTGLAAALKL